MGELYRINATIAFRRKLAPVISGRDRIRRRRPLCVKLQRNRRVVKQTDNMNARWNEKVRWTQANAYEM